MTRSRFFINTEFVFNFIGGLLIALLGGIGVIGCFCSFFLLVLVSILTGPYGILVLLFGGAIISGVSSIFAPTSYIFALLGTWGASFSYIARFKYARNEMVVPNKYKTFMTLSFIFSAPAYLLCGALFIFLFFHLLPT